MNTGDQVFRVEGQALWEEGCDVAWKIALFIFSYRVISTDLVSGMTALLPDHPSKTSVVFSCTEDLFSNREDAERRRDQLCAL